MTYVHLCLLHVSLGHLNFNHAHNKNKISDISSMLENCGKSSHIFGLFESRIKKWNIQYRGKHSRIFYYKKRPY